MSIFDEIAIALAIKMKKYCYIKLSPEENICLEDMLLSEAVNETILSFQSLNIRGNKIWQEENMKSG